MWHRGIVQLWKMLWEKDHWAYIGRGFKTSKQNLFARHGFGRESSSPPFRCSSDSSVSLPAAAMTAVTIKTIGETELHAYCKHPLDKPTWLCTCILFSGSCCGSCSGMPPSQWEEGQRVSAHKAPQSTVDAFGRLCGSIPGTVTPWHSGHVTYFAHMK